MLNKDLKLLDYLNPSVRDDGSSAKTETVTTTPTTTTPPLTYEQFYQNQRQNASNAYDKSVANAEIERQKAINDARNTYEHSLSTYGSNAAALGGMGLTGSGYSRYLDSKAYAQQQADINAANRTKQLAVDNATALKADKLTTIEGNYMNYLDNKENAMKSAYADLYSNVGSYSEADIDRLATQYGLSTQHINDLKAARTEKIKQYLDTNEYDSKMLKQFFPNEDGLYQQYYDKLKNEEKTYTADDFKTEGVLWTPSEALDKINALKASGVNTKKAEEVYKSLYGLGITGGGHGAFLSGNFAAEGKKITVKASVITGWNADKAIADEHEYKVEVGPKVTDTNSNVLKATSGVVLADGQVFYYDGELYINKSGYLYKLQKKGNNTDYDHLLSMMKNSK